MVVMTIKPIYKTCPICLRKYSWNPDIGQSGVHTVVRKEYQGLMNYQGEFLREVQKKEDKYLNNYDIFILMRWLKWLAHF